MARTSSRRAGASSRGPSVLHSRPADLVYDYDAVVAATLHEAVANRGRATVAFSGGSTAGPLLAALGDTEAPWEAVDVLQVDERVAPEGHPDRNLAGCPARLDLVHLGLGSDGHTASLVPDSPLLDEQAAPVGVTATYEGRRRMTLTLPVLNRAREVVWLVRGAAKAPMVRRPVRGDTSMSAGRVDPTRARLLVDHAAAAGLTPA